MTRMHEVEFEIFGDDMQFVALELDPQEAAVAEAGAVMYLDDGIEMETIFGDGSESQSGFLGALMGAGKRLLTGESLFMTVFSNQSPAKKKVAFGAPYPGKVVPIYLPDVGGTLVTQKDSFLCAAKGVSIGIAFQKRIGAGLFGGEGFIMQRLEGDGTAFVHAGGTLAERELAAGETVRVDTGCIVGFPVPALQPARRPDLRRRAQGRRQGPGGGLGPGRTRAHPGRRQALLKKAAWLAEAPIAMYDAGFRNLHGARDPARGRRRRGGKSMIRSTRVLCLGLALSLCLFGSAWAKGEATEAGNPVVVMKTSMGTIEIELWPEKAPITVENFLGDVDKGFFDGTVFHRVIKGFMIQGGGFDTDMKKKATGEPIKNEADHGLSNLTGTIAMARTNVVDSATAQFFINTVDNARLDHSGPGSRFGYAVFGKVTSGLDVVKAIEATPTAARDVPIKTVTIESVTRKP
jgi:uncharacterized protein (AIM24 family)/cyclophilin family peptidyl-prolyl cis-trans isomerase